MWKIHTQKYVIYTQENNNNKIKTSNRNCLCEYQMIHLEDKYFYSAFISIFKEIKITMLKQLKKRHDDSVLLSSEYW